MAVAFEIEGFGAVGMLGAAVAIDAGKGGVDTINDSDTFVDTDFHAAETAVDIDDGTVADVGMTQVEADKTEASVYINALKSLSVKAIVLLAKRNIYLLELATVHDNGLGIAGGVAMAAATFFVEEEQRDTPNHSDKADDILPNITPDDNITCRQEQQYTNAEPDDGACLVLVIEEVDKTGHDDEDGPPSF